MTATDFFCRWEHAPAIWAAIQAHPLIRGAGIYDAMRFRGPAGTYCMVHIDLREVPLNWVGYGRDPVEYIYEPNEPDRYSRLVRNLLENQS